MNGEGEAEMILNYRRLMDTKRCNNFPTNRPEDVAQHSYYVAMLSVLIATDYNKTVAKHNSKLHHYDDSAWDVYDVNELALRGMFHDVEEAFISDIPRNIKHSSPEVKNVIELAVCKKLDEIFSNAGCVGEYVMSYNKTAKDGFNGSLIDLVDMLELAIYCNEEVLLGNSLMKPLLDKAVKIMKEKENFQNVYERSPLFASLYNMLSCESPKKRKHICQQAMNID